MRLNQNEEDLFNEIDKIEFDFDIDDDINKLEKEEKIKVMKEINDKDKLSDNETDELNNNE